MLFILGRSRARAARVTARTYTLRASCPVLRRAMEMIDIGVEIGPHDRVGVAIHPCPRFRAILVGAGLPCTVVTVRQARAAGALRQRSGLPGRRGASTLAGRPGTRISVGKAGAAGAAAYASLDRAGARPEIGNARTARAARCVGRRRRLRGCRGRFVGAVIEVGQARAAGTLGGVGRDCGKRQQRKKCEGQWRFYCLSPVSGGPIRGRY